MIQKNIKEKKYRIGKNDIRKFLKKIRPTLKNFGWWLLAILLLLCFIGIIRRTFFTDGYFIDPFIWLINLFFFPFGTSLDTLDYRYTFIFRGLGDGAVLTFMISIVSVGIGFIIAGLLAVILVQKGRVFGLKYFAQAYVDFFRSTPLLVQILIIYFGIPALFPTFNPTIRELNLSSEVILGTIALSLNTGAYQAEILRGGILAIPTGQTEASRALGMTAMQTMRYVIFPQALRLILPPLTNELINVILNSSLVSAIGVLELTKKSQSLQSYYFWWPIFFIAAVYYFVITFSLSKITKRIEEKYRIPGLGVSNE